MRMKKYDIALIRDLLDRIARLNAAEEWTPELNPAQRGVLAYLSRANKFSRAPSNVADFMCTTRGTASQTLKALEAKGFVAQTRSTSDKRSISYDVSQSGRLLINGTSDLDTALTALTAEQSKAFRQSLEATVHEMLRRREFRSFGICNTCKYHQTNKEGRFCELLNLPLTDGEAEELCHEHDSIAQSK